MLVEVVLVVVVVVVVMGVVAVSDIVDFKIRLFNRLQTDHYMIPGYPKSDLHLSIHHQRVILGQQRPLKRPLRGHAFALCTMIL